ncbi:ABC transporter B family member 1 [Pelomyxa schiedti]|nr:ABC transporter B family member 1 [Pelomyxa schiedti]
MIKRMRSQLFLSIVRQEIGFFDTTKSGELLNRLADDSAVVQTTLTTNISVGVRNVATGLGSIIFLFIISWKLSLVMLGIVPVIVIVAVVYGRFVRKLGKQAQDALAKAASVAEEAFVNIRVVRSFSKEAFESDKYVNRVQDAYKIQIKSVWANGSFMGGMLFFGNIAMLLVLWYGAILVLKAQLSPGELASFIFYTLIVAVSLATVSNMYGDLMKATGASERIFQLIDRVPLAKSKGGEVLSSIGGEIILKGVSFHYPSRPTEIVLKGIDLSLEPGKIVALVGPSGSGKSTIVNLIEQFYYPDTGFITLDGKDMKELDPEFLHSFISLVSQEPTLFCSSIFDNIVYGTSKSPTREEVEEAARAANAHEFIGQLADGYDTIVGERGTRLSGGQKQRVAIARAILSNPRVLLLDEATSALDAESEHLVQEALDRLMHGRTVLVIAHRLSTVQSASEVCVLDKGKIVERGTHAQLLEMNGLYSILVKRQLQGGVDTTATPPITTITTTTTTSPFFGSPEPERSNENN